MVVAFQKYTDRFLAKTLLPFIPLWISPNQVSMARIFCIPPIFYLLITENYLAGFIIFSIAALTDALDGAMARTRDRVTELGKFLDALADKGLIFLVAFIFIPKYFGWILLILIGFLELLNAFMAYRSRKKNKIKSWRQLGWKNKDVCSMPRFWNDFYRLILYSFLLAKISRGFAVCQSNFYFSRVLLLSQNQRRSLARLTIYRL